MKLKFFRVPALHPGPAKEELDEFICRHRVSPAEHPTVAGAVACTLALVTAASSLCNVGRPRHRSVQTAETIPSPDSDNRALDLR